MASDKIEMMGERGSQIAPRERRTVEQNNRWEWLGK